MNEYLDHYRRGGQTDLSDYRLDEADKIYQLYQAPSHQAHYLKDRIKVTQPKFIEGVETRLIAPEAKKESDGSLVVFRGRITLGNFAKGVWSDWRIR